MSSPATLALLADLLEYPGPDLPGRLDAGLSDAPVRGSAAAAPLGRFRDELAREGYVGFQEAYTRVFDFDPESAPYLGHHLFGEDMRRGAFMAHLKKRYAETGLSSGTEVPDHLSAVLRFAARLEPGEEADELVHDCLVPAAARLGRALEQKASPYALVLQALLLALQPFDEPTSPREDATCRPSSSSSSPM
ncbi:MAG: nitrate reductase molybdenum cofactor assembly chaperone [Acidobacteriota bacterium]|nr:nitrate reductase molybdenum cofactor assembly chaperone [Acidobacteriota bacterium]